MNTHRHTELEDHHIMGCIAQLAERRIVTAKVVSSNLITPPNFT
jgi:hypothetical protein